MSIDNVTLSLSNVMGKQTSSMVVETFDRHHVMMMTIERYGQMCRLITLFLLCSLQLYTKSSKIMPKTVVKNVNIKTEFHFFSEV